MRIDAVVSVNGLEANGATTATCPLCHTPDSLQIRQGGGNCHCSQCLEADDIVGFYAKARRLDLKSALKEMFEEELIEDDPEAFSRYISEREPHDEIQALFEDGQQRIRQNAWPSALTVLAGNDIHVEHGYGMDAISARVGIIHPSDIESYGLDAHSEFKALMRWMNQAACLISPIYSYRTRVEGVIAVNRKGQYRIARLGYGSTKKDSARRLQQGTLFTRSIRRDDPVVVIVTEPFEAWRLMMKMCRVVEPTTPLIGVYSATPQVSPIKDLGHRTCVFWSPSILSSYYWAETHNGSQVSSEAWVNDFEALGAQQLLSRIIACGADRHAAMAAYLASCDDSTAQKLVDQLRQNEAELNAVMAAALPMQRSRVRRMIVEDYVAGEITYRNTPIHVSSDGCWRAGSSSDGDIISEATIHLDSIVSSGGVVYVTGAVHMQGTVYEFKERLSQIRKGANWLENFLVAAGAPLPYVDRKWRTHLYDIALLFHKPDTVAPGKQVGWSGDDDTLTMTNFRVSAGGIQHIDYVASDLSDSGSGLTAPMPLQDSEIEESLGDETFWYLFIYLAGHLLRDRIGCEIPSLALSGRFASTWASSIRRALSLSYNTATNPKSTIDTERRSILPVVVDPVNEEALVDWLRLDGHRAVVVVDGPAVPLMRYKRWIVLEPQQPPGLHVVTLLPQIFWFVVYTIPFLNGLRQSALSKGPFWALGGCVASWAIRQPDGSRKSIDEATGALYRAHGVGEQERDESWHTIRLLRELSDGGFVQVIEDEHQRYQSISWADVSELFARFRFSVTSYLTIKRRLAPYLYEGPSDGETLMIKYNDWVLTGAMG